MFAYNGQVKFCPPTYMSGMDSQVITCKN